MTELAFNEIEVGPIYIASWHDEGLRFAPAKAESNTIKIAKKAGATGELRLTLYTPLKPHSDVTLRLNGHDELLGPRNTVYKVRKPSPKEAETALRVIAKDAELLTKQQAAKPPKPPKAPKPPKDKKAAKSANAKSGTKTLRTRKHDYLGDKKAQIHIGKKVLNPYKGSREKRFALLKDGMTVGEFLAAMAGAGFKDGQANFTLADGVARGLIKVGG
jgi:hypothetical protein